MEIKEIQKRAYETAKRRGQYDGNPSVLYLIRQIQAECKEVEQAYYEGALETQCDLFGKPTGVPSEFADVILTTLSVAEHLHIDMDTEIEAKQDYNDRRDD